MTCEDFLERLCDPSPSTAEMIAHARSCARCRPFLDLESALAGYVRGSPRAAGRASRGAGVVMSARLRRELARPWSPPRPYAPLRRARLPASVVLLALAAVLALGRRPDLARVPVWVLAVAAMLFLGMFALGLR